MKAACLMGAAARRALWLRRSAEAIVGDEVWKMTTRQDGGGKAGGCDLNKRLRKYQSSPGNPPHRKPPSPKRCYAGSTLGILSCEGNGRMSLHVSVLQMAGCSIDCPRPSIYSLWSLSGLSELRRALSCWTCRCYVMRVMRPTI